MSEHYDLMNLARMAAEPLHPDLVPYVEESKTLRMTMLRHPLVYVVPLSLPGLANKAYAHKQDALGYALGRGDWHTVVFLHERPYRLNALIDYVTGRTEDGRVLPLGQSDSQAVLDLVADVWVDSENIEQNLDVWTALFGSCREFYLGNEEERLAYLELPDMIQAYRAGIDDGGWSWTTDEKIAWFFAKRFQKPGKYATVQGQFIPKSRVFGYLTRRGESELLVRREA